MHLIRAAQAVPYQAHGHTGVDSRRLQGSEVGGPDKAAVSVSTYLPGSAVAASPTAADTIYVVLAGELELNGHLGEASLTLAAHDSVFLPRGEVRSLRNRTAENAMLLVVLLTEIGGADERPAHL
ncbi:cupin domain-containing protein [Nocardia sp. A7]|uniref:cupin domain-containing protein n=1 Tax=Nocardia sp. A7 TaxID=2789274 RepID=UPI00397E7ABF